MPPPEKNYANKHYCYGRTRTETDWRTGSFHHSSNDGVIKSTLEQSVTVLLKSFREFIHFQWLICVISYSNQRTYFSVLTSYQTDFWCDEIRRLSFVFSKWRCLWWNSFPYKSRFYHITQFISLSRGSAFRTKLQMLHAENQISLDPVVRSIVSLTRSLVVKMLTVLVTTISNSQVFLLKKLWAAFANAKATHIFLAKILAYNPYLMIEVLTIRKLMISIVLNNSQKRV